MVGAILIFIAIVASPGPATLAIMNYSMKYGKKHGILFSIGVILGSAIWGAVVIIGLIPVITSMPMILEIITLFGGVYIIWLGLNFFKSALSHNHISQAKEISIKKVFITGFLLHLTNPKAALAWATVILVASNGSEINSLYWVWYIYALCLIFCIFVFIGYALMFSNKSIIKVYKNKYYIIDFLMSIFFLYVGASLVLSYINETSILTLL